MREEAIRRKMESESIQEILKYQKRETRMKQEMKEEVVEMLELMNLPMV